ncbi:MAG: pseudouridine synthase, partial [Bacteroidales bacterium]
GFNREGGRGFDRSNNGGFNRESGFNRDRNNDANRGEGGFDKPRRSFDGEGQGSREGGFGRPLREGGSFNREGGRSFDRPNNGGFNREGGRSFDRPNSGGGFNRERSGGQGGFNRGGNSRPGSDRPFRKDVQDRPSRPVEYQDTITNPNEPIRLNKYLANAGTCSRREADEYIQAGVVKVNGEVVSELGTKVSRMDQVHFHDQLVKLESKVYVLLNKPKDCVTTADDPQARLTVMDLVKGACNERIYPVGRLDKNTTGVLLLTNDGDLASKLMHPKFSKKKIYHVWLDKDIPKEDLEKIAEGIELEDGEIHADAISYANEVDMNQIGIEIHSGRNRIVRRIFEHLGYKVFKLDRVYFAGLTKKNVQRGHWRYLSQTEVNMLRMGAFE